VDRVATHRFRELMRGWWGNCPALVLLIGLADGLVGPSTASVLRAE
jgi:hypothetical protein